MKAVLQPTVSVTLLPNSVKILLAGLASGLVAGSWIVRPTRSTPGEWDQMKTANVARSMAHLEHENAVLRERLGAQEKRISVALPIVRN